MRARSVHRSLATIAGAVALAWAASGFLHPLMQWAAPRPAMQPAPSGAASSDGLVAPGPALAAQGMTQATFLRLAETGAATVWLAEAPDGARMAVDARTGAPAPDADRQIAERLAQHYAGDRSAPVESAQLLTAFSTKYPGVNRLLPIWEVRLATPDALTLYVDTRTDRLATVSSASRRAMLTAFQTVHTLSFLDRWEPLRIAAIVLLVTTALAAAVTGIVMLARSRGRGLYGVHRAVAWVAAPLVLAFGISGLFHLVVSTPLAAPPGAEPPRAFSVADVAAPRLAPGRYDMSATAAPDGQGIWRVAGSDDAGLYFDAQGRVLALDDAGRAQAIAGREGDVQPIAHFTAAYGFINKRLPVHEVDGIFVDLREGLIAGRTAPGIAGVEAWTFDTIHKWEPLADVMGARNRDILTMLAVGVVAATAGLGLALRLRRRKEKQS